MRNQWGEVSQCAELCGALLHFNVAAALDIWGGCGRMVDPRCRIIGLQAETEPDAAGVRLVVMICWHSA